MENPTYATLLNQKLILPNTAANYHGIDQHFLLDLMLPTVSKIRLDERWYLATYPDVAAAVAAGTVSSAKMHYCRFGFFEHRMPYKIAVKEAWYINQYPDVREAVAAKRFASGQEHFELLGYREGRFPYSGFALDSAA